MWDIGARDLGYEAACFALDHGEERRGEETWRVLCRGVFLGGGWS